jgi:FKBP-type peptidyl-prolyl cis-trans isomerase
VHYVGTLTNGTVFDSSRASNQPFTFRLGVGQVIQGWDLGVPGMRVGGKRKLTIPPGLAYGNQQVGPIPPNSTLIFEIELLSIVGK